MKKFYYNILIMLNGEKVVDSVPITIEARSRYAANRMADRRAIHIIDEYDDDCSYPPVYHDCEK